MYEIIISIIQSVIIIFSISLKAIPLKGMLSQKRKNVLIILYILVLVINLYILTLIFIEKGTFTAFIKYDCCN